jgi:hypothetical protein
MYTINPAAQQHFQQFPSCFNNGHQAATQPTIVIIQPSSQYADKNANFYGNYHSVPNHQAIMLQHLLESGYNTADQLASGCISRNTSQFTSRVPSPQKFRENIPCPNIAMRNYGYNLSGAQLPPLHCYQQNNYIENCNYNQGQEGNLLQNINALKEHLQYRIQYGNTTSTISSDEYNTSDSLLNNIRDFDYENRFKPTRNSNIIQDTSPPIVSHNMADIALNSESNDGSANVGTKTPKTSRPMQVHIRFPNPRKQDDVYNVRYKTQPCIHFQRKRECPAGDNCHFAHGPEELRHTTTHQKFRTRFCVNFVRDKRCPYGNECHFRHE